MPRPRLKQDRSRKAGHAHALNTQDYRDPAAPWPRYDHRDAWVLSEEPANWPLWEWGSYRKLPQVRGWALLEVTA